MGTEPIPQSQRTALKHIGIIAGLPAEGSCLINKVIPLKEPYQIDNNVTLIISGIGASNAKLAAQRLLAGGNISALISWGTAAALRQDLQSGDLILANSVIGENATQYFFDKAWNQRVLSKLSGQSVALHHGIIAHTGCILQTPESKSALHTATQALAADMESGPIGIVARQVNLPCIAIRTIVDKSTQTIPAAITENIDLYGRPAWLPLISSLIRHPGLVFSLLHLGKNMYAATRTLRAVAESQAILA